MSTSYGVFTRELSSVGASAPPEPTSTCEASAPPCSESKLEAHGNSMNQTEIERLKEENDALRRALKQFQFKYPHRRMSQRAENKAPVDTSSPADAETQIEGEGAAQDCETASASARSAEAYRSLAESLNSPEGTKQMFAQLKEHISSPQFLDTLTQARNEVAVDVGDAVFVESADDPNAVGFVDISDLDWWTVVPRPSETEPFVEIEPLTLDGAYVFVEEDDIVQAIAEFVAYYITAIPATKHLSQEKLQKLLEGTFDELQEHGPLRKLWDWGQFLYVTYGWGQMGFNLYKEPETALFVMRSVWTASKWLLMGLSLA